MLTSCEVMNSIASIKMSAPMAVATNAHKSRSNVTSVPEREGAGPGISRPSGHASDSVSVNHARMAVHVSSEASEENLPPALSATAPTLCHAVCHAAFRPEAVLVSKTTSSCNTSDAFELSASPTPPTS